MQGPSRYTCSLVRLKCESGLVCGFSLGIQKKPRAKVSGTKPAFFYPTQPPRWNMARTHTHTSKQAKGQTDDLVRFCLLRDSCLRRYPNRLNHASSFHLASVVWGMDASCVPIPLPGATLFCWQTDTRTLCTHT